MKVIMDYREPKEILDMVTAAFRDYGGECVIDRLDQGDFLVEGKYGVVPIERKTVPDYLISLQTGRLSNQLYNLSSAFDISYLVTIGYFALAMEHTQIKRASYISSLIHSTLKRSPEGKQGIVYTANIENEYDFALFVAMLGSYLDEGEVLRSPQLMYSEADKLSLKAILFTACPGIGEERAKNLMRKFRSLDNVFFASTEEIEEVRDFGPKIANDLHNFLHENLTEDEI